MSLCASCRLALRHALRHRRLISTAPTPTPPAAAATSTTTTPIPQSIRAILAEPSWSVSSLFSQDPASPPPEDIPPAQLHHLLRLSALPLPETKADEDAMLATIQSQLHFVKAVQEVDTDGVEPLRAIRDESPDARSESTVGLDDLQEVLAGETLVGHYRRPKRTREKVESAAEGWDALSTASRRAGKYFVVDSGKKTDAGA
ncbi:hypothetical protein ESCO_003579 [Escovopsis weberi]|uniref:Glutamyl-tRNA amidotransferase complex subunit Gta3 domain-containing protein n=1 Tax=Escovopsis weberi TaxID=150374 RepID=A0A0M9VX17_ESCWE|nr:hypothetical protein ESCO_003579 [Escovopsis weberi]